MTRHSPDDFVMRNQAALEELAWSIEMAQGQFTLLLARCNYASLRQQIVAEVQERCPVPIRVVTLPETATTLYTSLKAELGEEPPQAVMVFGLEAVQNLEQMLASTNQVREEFRKAFPFPLVLWVTDEVSKQLIRLAPDFHSWSTTTEFLITTDTLLASLRQGADSLFATLLTPDSPLSFARLWTSFSLGDLQRSELEAALTDLQKREQSLEPELQASLDLLRGLESGIHPEALTYLDRSLKYWQQAGDRFSLRIALLLFFFGRYHYYATEQERSTAPDWNQAKRPLQQALEIFAQADRSDLVAKCTTQLERVLEQCQDWDELERLAQRSLPLQQRYGSLSRLAQDYRYLAEVALHRSQWQVAQQWAQQAWDTLQQIPEEQRWAGLYLLTLAQAKRGLNQVKEWITHLTQAHEVVDQGMPRLYIRILTALREFYLNQKRYFEAFQFKQMRMSIEQQYGIQAFVGAGWLKPQREEAKEVLPIDIALPETVAPEIAASGRQRDLDELVNRIGRNDYKLIVIHGLSGVGKSSLVTAGLVPALKQKAIGIQENLPVVVRTYTDWLGELGQQLAQALAEKRARIQNRSSLNTPTGMIEQLRWNEQQTLRTVLIFDQFEEFFFVYPDPIDRKRFFEFLGGCLQILSVKVILSLREDYLHYLLECSRLSNIAATGIDILSRNVLYGLGNFSPADARAIIQDRTSRSQFYLEPDLVEALVQDLAGELGEVRPIELQVVGAQLQAENITTLEPYRALGENPKEELVKRYLAEVVQDCGAENQQIAELVLYLLTDEKGTRPLKTRPELERELEALVAEVTENPERLDLVLKILVDSGLVVLLPELPLDRYQLVHDYLAVLIQQQQAPRLEQLIIELDEERKQRLAIEEKKKAIELELQQTEQARQALENAHQEARQILEEARIAAQLERESINILKKFESSQLEALLQATRSAKALQALVEDDRSLEDYPTIRPIETLRTILANIQQRNQIKVQSGAIFRVLFSPDAEKVAVLGLRGIAELWSVNGKKLAEFSKHGEHCNDISFSPDGQLLATAGQSDIVQLWHPSGQLITEFQGHHGKLWSIRFTLDGKQVATGGRDGYVRLWNLDGQLLSEFKAYPANVWKLRCSPNAQEIATIGGWLNTIHLWDLKGKQVAQFSAESKTTQEVTNSGLHYLWDEETKTLLLEPPLKNSPAETAGLKEGDRIVAIEGKAVQDADFRQKLAATSEAGLSLKIQRHNEELNVLLQRAKYTTIVPVSFQAISFSPDGEQIASVANDGFVRIWNRNGEQLNEFKAHPTVATDISFSPDGQQIATVSYDSTTRLWNQSGQELIQFRGHQGRTFSVNFSLDGNRVATASGDGTISIWNLAKPKVHAIKVLRKAPCVNLSPNSYYLAASDNTGRNVGIWNFEGQQISELVGHFGKIRCVTFNPTSELVATGGEDKTARLWNLQGQQLAQLEGHQELVFGVAFSPNGQQIATASGDSTARLWDLAGTQLVEFTGHEGSVWKAHFSPNGHYLATAGGDGTARLWNLSGQQLTIFKGHRGVVWDVAFSPDGRYLATAGGDGTARLWDLSGQQFKEFGEYHSHLDKVYFSPNGKILVTVAHQGPVWLWSLSGLLLTELRDQAAVDVHFREDSQQITVVGEDGYIHLIPIEYPTLKESIKQGCCWLKDYLTNNPEVTNDDRALCGIPPSNPTTTQAD